MLEDAMQHLMKAGEIIRKSKVYETAPWGNRDQDPFLNQAVIFNTQLEPDELLTYILEVEESLGRVRRNKWEPRLIDIDILLFDYLILNSGRLTIPHPLLQERRFALEPLREILPDYVHPVFLKTVEELYIACSDPETVHVYHQ